MDSHDRKPGRSGGGSILVYPTPKVSETGLATRSFIDILELAVHGRFLVFHSDLTVHVTYFPPLYLLVSYFSPCDRSWCPTPTVPSQPSIILTKIKVCDFTHSTDSHAPFHYRLPILTLTGPPRRLQNHAGSDFSRFHSTFAFRRPS